MDYPPINIRAFLLTFWVFWAFWNDKRKIEKQQKNEICNRNADLPCWWPRICWKTLFRLCSSKVETKNKISTCYTKNVDRILKYLDKLRSNFYKLVNLRLATITFWNPGFMTLNLKIIFQNCWHNNLTNPNFCQFTVNMYCQFTDTSQSRLVDVMCESLPTEKTWMLEQRETSKLKLLLTNNGCAPFGASKRLFVIVSAVLFLPSILQYDIISKRIIIREDISLCVFNFLWKLEEQKFTQNKMPNLENSVQN